MKRLMNWFCRTLGSRPTSARHPRCFRPKLEQLDDRMLLATGSSAISILHSSGGSSWTERDWYTKDMGQHFLQAVEFQGTSRRDLGGPWVYRLSASIDPKTGSAEVFVLDTGYALWLCDSTGNWHSFGGKYNDIAATRDGHVYATDFNHIHYLDSNGNGIDIGAPQPGLLGPHWQGINDSALAASISFSGSNEVFALGSNLAIYVNSANAPWHWQLVDDNAQFEALSAAPNDTVFAVTTDGRIFEDTYAFHWLGNTGYFYWHSQDISWGMQYFYISADLDTSGRAEVYATGLYDNNAYRFDQGSWTQVDTGVFNIEGADGGYFYDVNYDNGNSDAYLYTPNSGPWYVWVNPWTYLGSSLW